MLFVAIQIKKPRGIQVEDLHTHAADESSNPLLLVTEMSQSCKGQLHLTRSALGLFQPKPRDANLYGALTFESQGASKCVTWDHDMTLGSNVISESRITS